MEYNMANLKEFTHDYTERTMANYNTVYCRYIEESVSFSEEEIEDAFEVTQLINSLFGILIMPFESVKALKGKMGANNKRDVNRKMKMANPDAFEDLSNVIRELKNAHRFYDSYIVDYEKGIDEIAFVHRLRNSLAHSGNSGLRFFPIGEGNQEVRKIKSIIFCDEDREECFIAELSVNQVERVLKSLAAIFGNYSDFGDFYELKDYKDTIRSMRNKMESAYEGVFEFDMKDKRMVEDKFKGNLRIERIEDNKSRGCTLVFNEMDFFTWIFQSKGGIKLVGPKHACENMNHMVRAALQN